ncbi:MAG: Holliday junction DNA helicase RuvA [Deltaproteobacteria bacterium]|nr:Holliday junction DNA helicase RuvA [Deltaproteobacteria bacterium]
MIRYLCGTVIKAEENKIVVLTGGVGYEVLLPEIVRQALMQTDCLNKPVELFISYHQTVQQPKPVLIGFSTELELEFFEALIKVKDIGPTMACRALTLPIPLIARAIEDRDAGSIQQLKGIGKRKADMIISELQGRLGKFALMRSDDMPPPAPASGDLVKQVTEVLVRQLGHQRTEAQKMVQEALERRPEAASPEELFEEVYRGTRPHAH